MDPVKLSAETVIDDRYVIVERLGAGGMGTVYKAFEKSLNRVVALKFLHPWLVFEDDHLRRFEQEGKILCSLVHENVLRCYRFGLYDDEIPYLAMEYLEGSSLREILSDAEEPIAPALTLKLMIQVCDGLAAAHRQGVLHRDLKPENIFVDSENETAKILDFGLAKVFLGTDSGQKQTKTGALVGTVQYMSPEQCKGNKADERSDVYALSCIIYECLTGHRAFETDNPIAYLHLHVHAARPSLSGLFPPGAMQDSLQAVLNKGLAVDPNNRYKSMHELKESLQLISEGQYDRASSAHTAQTTTARKSRPAIFASIAVLVLAVGISLLIFFPPSFWEKQYFFRHTVLTSSITEKMESLLRSGMADDASLYLHDLETHLMRSSNPDDVLGAGRVDLALRAAGKIEQSQQLEKTILRLINQMVKRKDIDIREFNNLARLNIEIASRDPHSVEYRVTVKRLFTVAAAHSYSVDHKLLLDLSQRYLEILSSKARPDPCEVHRVLLEKMQALLYTDAPPAEIDRAVADVLASIKNLNKRKDGELIVHTLVSVASSMPPEKAGKLYADAVEIQNQFLGTKGKKELYSRVGVNSCQRGKHQEALDFLLESRNLARNDFKSINLKDVVYKSASIHESIGVLQLRLETSIAREYLHVHRPEEARLYLDSAMEILRKVAIIPNDAQYSLLDLPYTTVVIFETALSLNQANKGEEAVEIAFTRARPVYGENLAAYPKDFQRLDRFYRIWTGSKWACKQMLGREPNSSDWPWISGLIEKPEANAFLIMELVAGTPDFKARFKGKSPEEQIDLLYQLAFDRPSDPGGRKFWVEQLRKSTLDMVIKAFVGHPEEEKFALSKMDLNKVIVPGEPPHYRSQETARPSQNM